MIKSLQLIGGILGFVSGFVFSWLQDEGAGASLMHGCVAAVVVGILLPRWERSLKVQGARETLFTDSTPAKATK